MSKESGAKQEARFKVTYFDGLNATVQPTLAKRTELSHAENARSPIIGVLEKREGQTVKGTSPNGNRFIATANYGLARLLTTNSGQQGIFRISASSEPTQTVSVSVSDQIYINEARLDGASPSPSTTSFQTFVIDNVAIDDSTPGFITNLSSASFTNGNTISVRNDVRSCNIYYLSRLETWVKLSDTDAQSIVGGQFDFTIANESLVIVNQNDKNRLLDKDGSTVLTSADAGSLYNSPQASKACFYKGRIHLADFVSNGIRYPTTIIRSSYPLGVAALVNGDHASGVTTLNVTDTKYFYTASGMNLYDIYRGGTRIQTITVSGINETSLTVTATTAAINSSDEIWVARTVNGSGASVDGTFNSSKQFRWVNNATATGRDVKQYDTFRLSGGDGDPITLFETVGNVIMIGNQRSLAMWDDYTLQMMDLGIGCSSKNGYAKLLGTLYFLDQNGAYATTGGVPTLISRKVERYFKGATVDGLQNAAVGVKGLSVMFTIGDSTLYKEDGSVEKVLHDVCLEYSVADQNWYVHTNVPIGEFQNFKSTDGAEHLLGTHNGNSKSVMDFLSGFTDDGQEIFFRIDTQELQLLQEFETFVNPLAVITEVVRGSQMKCYISIDKDDFYPIEGMVGKGVSALKVNSRDPTKTQPVIGRKIKLSYRDSSKQRCRINQFAVVYKPTSMDEPIE